MNQDSKALSNVTIQLASGRMVRPFASAEEIARELDVRDVAHHLSHLCRFTGAVREFYSVAQHSVLVSRLVEHRLRSEGQPWIREATKALHHDDDEMITNDLASPIKHALGLEAYVGLGDHILDAAAIAFGLGRERKKDLAWLDAADKDVCAAEAAILMPCGPSLAALKVPDFIVADIRAPMVPAVARRVFLQRHHHLEILARPLAAPLHARPTPFSGEVAERAIE